MPRPFDDISGNSVQISNRLVVTLMPFLVLAGCGTGAVTGCDALALVNSGDLKAFERWASTAETGSWRCGDIPLIVAVSDTAYADKAVEILLQHGGNATEVDPRSKRTALHNLASWGATGAAQMLLERGANPNAQDTKGVTPLMSIAATKGIPGDVQLVELLLKSGAIPTIKDNSGRTAADYAGFAGNSVLQQRLEDALK